MLSLLVHAAFLLAVASVVPARLAAPAATINAVLRADARQVPPPTLASAPKAPARAVLARPLVQAGAARRLAPDQSPLPASVPPSAQATPAEAGAASPVAADSAIAPDARQAGLRSGALVLSPAAPNADDLRQYRVSLAIAARRFKRYPVMARERGWQGTAEVALTLRAGFPVPEVILVRSSGHPVLDRQAQEMMAQAARAIVLPESLLGRDLQIMLPVQFTLDDQ